MGGWDMTPTEASRCAEGDEDYGDDELVQCPACHGGDNYPSGLCPACRGQGTVTKRDFDLYWVP